MTQMKTPSNYDTPIQASGFPVFMYATDAAYENHSTDLDYSLWKSLDNSDRVIPNENSTLWEKPTMDSEHIVLSFKQAIDDLRSDALELMYVAKSEDGYIEIWIYGNRIPEQVQNRIYEIDFEFAGRFPDAIGDVHVSDRRGRPMQKHATFDLTNEDSYALYRLSSQLWLPTKSTTTSGNGIAISLRS
jgi:hypothetical protein